MPADATPPTSVANPRPPRRPRTRRRNPHATVGCTRPWTFDGQRKALRLHRLIEQVGGGAPALAGKRTDLPRIVGVYRLSRDCRQELRGRRGDRGDDQRKYSWSPAGQGPEQQQAADARHHRARRPERSRRRRPAGHRRLDARPHDSLRGRVVQAFRDASTRFDSWARLPTSRATLKPRQRAPAPWRREGRRTATGTNAQHGTTNTASGVDPGRIPLPTRRGLPWRPDVIIVVTPNQGHAKHHLVPWANALDIPVLSIDHGSPTVLWPWLTYRGSMMGCTANAVWSTVCRDINVGVGAPAERQIITGSPSLDGLQHGQQR